MADRDSLENLIEGMAGAVVEAQRRIESHQIKNFLSYFDKHNRPKGIDILLPSLTPTLDPKAPPPEDSQYFVPYLPLFASSMLQIKDVEISFDTDITGITDTAEEDATPSENVAEGDPDIVGARKKKSVGLDIRSGGSRKRAGRAHVVLKVKGGEPSEGMARVIDRLLRMQGETE